MTIPNNERCRKVIKELVNEDTLTEFESDFVDSNRGRVEFSDKQKLIIASLIDKYDV